MVKNDKKRIYNLKQASLNYCLANDEDFNGINKLFNRAKPNNKVFISKNLYNNDKDRAWSKFTHIYPLVCNKIPHLPIF